MEKIRKIIMVSALLGFSFSAIHAQDDPEKILKDVVKAPLNLEIEGSSNERKWKNWVNTNKWGNSKYIGGVQHFQKRDMIVSVGTAYVNIRVGQPGWNEARMAAFERAELIAKSNVVSFLGEQISNQRSINLLEKAQFDDGKIQQIKQVQSKWDNIVNKSTLLIDAKLDAQLKKLDDSYNPTAFKKLSPKQQKTAVEQIFKRAITRSAMRSLIGITPVYNAESINGNQYEVLVGVVWSPKLNRLAVSLTNDTYNIPKVATGQNINNWVGELNTNIIGMYGTRIMVDENGHYNVLAFAQAQPRRSSPSREQSALSTAKSIAANRARAMITNFIKEKISLTENETSKEIFQEFDDYSTGARSLRNFQQAIKGHKKTIKLSGIATLRQWSMKHPVTGQKVAGSVVLWSPSSRKMSKDMDNVMRLKPKSNMIKQGKKSFSNEVIESINIETTAY